ncbi:hypothetical protein RHSIM_Rhsim03G0084200 [Rhododendron simsii]|uniref:RNase H type-1 domain-containing protein n=1 Tax=Rhododendron simsii TaxID=118357 RepID=A0A834H804_RHOSS|nr:hypothetical protein RHSIM_Rhsim03G0084200 [Rhododendron simsii]
MMKEVTAAMKNHHQVMISTEISSEDTVESTSVGNRSSLLLTPHHHHQQTIASNDDHHPVNNFHAFSIADDYNPVEIISDLGVGLVVLSKVVSAGGGGGGLMAPHHRQMGRDRANADQEFGRIGTGDRKLFVETTPFDQNRKELLKHNPNKNASGNIANQKARNDLVFQSLKQSPISIVARAMGAWDEFISASETFSSTHQSFYSSPPLPSSHWIPPGAGSMKINCDASWSKDLKRGWGGIILRDYRGHLVDGRRFRILANSAFLAEASVLREACLFAKALNLSSVCIENDNAQLISLSVSELVPPWEALAIISDIRLLASDLRLSLCWTPREGNEAAHWIASSQASSLGLDWVVSPPAVLISILRNDAFVYQ